MGRMPPPRADVHAAAAVVVGGEDRKFGGSFLDVWSWCDWLGRGWDYPQTGHNPPHQPAISTIERELDQSARVLVYEKTFKSITFFSFDPSV